MTLHHLGYAVRSIEQSRLAFEALGYKPTTNIFADTSRNCNIQFLEISNGEKSGFPSIELIATLDPNLPSPVTTLVKKAQSVLYHPCFVATDITTEILKLTENGYRLLHDTAPAPAIGETAVVAFLHEPNVGLIELVQL